MDKRFAVLLYLLQELFLCQATQFNFLLTKSSDWGWPGSCRDYTLRITIPETTPVKIKIKAPYNGSAVLRIMETKIKSNTCSQITGSATPTLSSRAAGNSGIMDIAQYDLGQVTVAGTCVIQVDAKLQLLEHPGIVHGHAEWLSLGVEYINQSVWAAQQALRTMIPRAPRPYLDIKVEPAKSVLYDVLVGPQVVYNIKVIHDCKKTSANIESSVLELDVPSSLAYVSFTPGTKSIPVQLASKSGVRLKFTTAQFNFSDVLEFNMTFNLDTSKAFADSKIHQATSHVHMKYNGTHCTSPTKEFEQKEVPTPSMQFYSPYTACDVPLGMTNGLIANEMISASSYSGDGAPHLARLLGPSSWKPSGILKKDLNQYLQVNFTSRSKIRHIATQGCCNSTVNSTGAFVKSFKLYYSDNGAIWTPYKEGSKDQVFEANKNAIKIAIIPLENHIEAKYVRINPREFNTAISLRVEFYGCPSSTPQPVVISYPSRSILLVGNTIYVCNNGMTKKIGDSSCFYSTDGGDGWTAVNFKVKHIAFSETPDKLYGIGGNTGKLMYRSESGSWSLIAGDEFNRVKGLATVHAKSADHLSITDDASSGVPQTADQQTATGGTKWGCSGKGVHASTNSGTTWSLKASWSCNEPGE